MLVLLAALPYVAAIAVYWLGTAALFREAGATPPSNWSWRLVGPVMVGGLTPLALAAKAGLPDSQRWLLLSATGIAIVYTLVSMGLLRDGKRFFALQIALAVGDRKFNRWPRWIPITLLGSLVLAYGATVNVIVANKG